jgi:hypothetical protein
MCDPSGRLPRGRSGAGEPGLGPERLVEVAATRAVAIPAGVVGEVGVAATVAHGEVAEAARAAGQDVGRGLGLFVVQTQPGLVVAEPLREECSDTLDSLGSHYAPASRSSPWEGRGP